MKLTTRCAYVKGFKIGTFIFQIINPWLYEIMNIFVSIFYLQQKNID